MKNGEFLVGIILAALLYLMGKNFLYKNIVLGVLLLLAGILEWIGTHRKENRISRIFGTFFLIIAMIFFMRGK